jgi:hypothetical protein
MASELAVWVNMQGGIPLRLLYVALFFVTLLLALAPMTRFQRSRFFSRYSFLIFLSLYFIVSRLPTFCAGEQNPDESFLLSNAMLFLESPGKFLTMDMGTHGPLTSLPLAFTHLIGFSSDYGMAKTCWAGAMLCSILSFYGCIIFVSNETFSRMCALSAASFFGSIVFWDMSAFNGEVTVILELMAAMFFVMNLRYNKRWHPVATACSAAIVLGCIVITKIQGIPIGIVVAIYGAYSLRRRLSEAGENSKAAISLFILSGVAPLAVYLAIFICQGRLNDFLVRYIYGQWVYATSSSAGIAERLSSFFRILIAIDVNGGNLFFLVFAVTAFISIVSFPFLKLKKKLDYREGAILELFFVASALTVAAIYSIIQPGNFFYHYYLLLYFPVLLLFVSVTSFLMLNGSQKFKSITYSCMCIGIVFFWLSWNLLHRIDKFGYWYTYTSTDPLPPYTPNNNLTEIIMSAIGNKKPNIFVWGWKDSIYVEAKLPRTVATNTSLILSCKYNCDYYVKQMVNELGNDPPAVFVDAIEPTAFAYTDRSKYGFDLIPEIKDFVEKHYVFTNEVDGVKVYRLRDG